MKKFKVATVILVLVVALVGCQLNSDATRKIKQDASGSWFTKIDPLGKKPGAILVTTDMGSHTLTVSVPKLDEGLATLLDEAEMGCVELHFMENEGGPSPICETEPKASAVYYFYDVRAAGNDLEIAWTKTDADRTLITGLRMARPVYIIKIAVDCQDDDASAIERMYLSDTLGINDGKVIRGIDGATFSENSLRTAPTFAGELLEL